MKYLFYNVYGDADELISTKPEDVIAVPYGWDGDTETKRNQILSELNLNGVSGLPCYIFPHSGYKRLIPERQDRNLNLDQEGNVILDKDGNPTFSEDIILLPAEVIDISSGYFEVPIFTMGKPWNWDEILRKENEILIEIENLTNEANAFLQNP